MQDQIRCWWLGGIALGGLLLWAQASFAQPPQRAFQGTAANGSILSGIRHPSGQVAIPPTYMHIDSLAGGLYLCELPAGQAPVGAATPASGFSRLDYLMLHPGRCTACHLLTARLRQSVQVYSLAYPVQGGVVVRSTKGMQLLDTLLRPRATYAGLMPLGKTSQNGYVCYNGTHYGLLHPDGTVALSPQLEAVLGPLPHYGPTNQSLEADWAESETAQFELLGNADTRCALTPETSEALRWLPAIQDGKLGLIDLHTRAWVLPPQLGFLHWLDSTHTHLVGQQPDAAGMGVWRATDLKPVLPETLAVLEHLQGPYLQAAVPQADGTYAWGVLHRATLEWSLKPTFRQLILQDKYLLLQDTAGLWGLAQARNMELLLPVAYHELAIENVQGSPWVRVHKGEQLGYYHPGKAAWLLPPVYDVIEQPQANSPLPGHWLVRLGDRLGLFDPATSQLALRPEWQHIALADSQHLVLQQPEQTYRYALATGQRTEVPRLESRWPLLWAQRVGYLSYRGSMLHLGPHLVVGTHTRVALGPADLLHNVATTDSTGLWLLEATTGRPLQHVVSLPGQDYPLSLNGVAAADQRIYATCDYNGVVAWALRGDALQLLWQAPQLGAAEGTPALADLNADGVADVVCTVRNHGVLALNGRTGHPLWAVLDTLQTLPYGSGMGSVALHDVNADGVADVLVGAPGRRLPDVTTGEWTWTDAADAYLWALDGRTGRALWQVLLERGTGVKASPVVVQGTGSAPQVQIATDAGGFYRLALNGAWLGSTRLPGPTVTTPIALGPGQYAYALSQTLPQGWGVGATGVLQLAGASSGIDRYGRPAQAVSVQQQWGGQASATPLVADVLGLGYPQALWVQEGGLLQVATPDGRTAHTFGLPAGAEATPLVADVDANGRPELLLLGKDGVLRCYRTPGVGVARWGAFRGPDARQMGQYLLY